MKTAFIDSNIWLYSFLKQHEARRLQAKELIASLRKKALIFVSSQVINEVCFNLLKNGVPEDEIKGIIDSFYSDFSVIEFSQAVIRRASDLREKYSLSFWDSLVLSSALEADCNVLYSEDMQHNQVIEKKLKIINPFAKG